jgi:hypothetical protein
MEESSTDPLRAIQESVQELNAKVQGLQQQQEESEQTRKEVRSQRDKAVLIALIVGIVIAVAYLAFLLNAR